jgi:hypothetical protein
MAKAMTAVMVVFVAALGLGGPAGAVNTWTVEVVDDPPAADVGSQSSIALDAAGRPHIAYFDVINFDIKYARKTSGGAWVVEVVEAGTATGLPSIAVDAAGHVHIAYHRSPNADPTTLGDVVYFRRACSGVVCFLSRTVIEAGIHDVARAGNVSLTLDGSGRPHIVYFDHVGQRLRWAKLDDSGWSLTTVVASPQGGTAWLALDGVNLPYIAYTNSGTSQVRYARVGCVVIFCGWSFETIDTGSVGSLAVGGLELDGAGNPHVSYFNGGAIKYATRGCGPRCAWRRETLAQVDPAAVTSRLPALALDPNGAPHVLYLDPWSVNAELHYLSRTWLGWSDELVDSFVSTFATVSLAFDLQGRAHISMDDQGADALRYAKGVPVVVEPPPIDQ